MGRELATSDHLVRTRWPALYWANRATLFGAALCLGTVLALFIFETVRPIQTSERSTLDGVIGAGYVLAAVFGVGFMLTG